MKVEVDMEKISAEIAAAEEAARKRMAEREKDAGDRGAREAPTCVLAEEEKHVCATHGKKSQQNSHSDSSSKEGEDAESNTADPPGEQPLCDFVCNSWMSQLRWRDPDTKQTHSRSSTCKQGVSV